MWAYAYYLSLRVVAKSAYLELFNKPYSYGKAIAQANAVES